MDEFVLRSPTLNNERRCWIQRPLAGARATAICLLLDGEYYVQRMEAPAVIAGLQESQQLPPVAVVYVSHIDGVTRWPESFCNERFARFVSEELIPWAKGQITTTAEDVPIILGGLSLTGLAAAHTAFLYPDSFAGVLCQSASFWWSDNWLTHQFQRAPLRVPPFRIFCGNLETADYVEHGPELIQRTSQLDSNRLMRDALIEHGCSISYEEFSGGHDIASWKADLPNSLQSLLGKPVNCGLSRSLNLGSLSKRIFI
jgi:enterochelin esterase-like enzyme